MSISLAFDDGQQAIHDALVGWCTEQGETDAVGRIAWSRSLWHALGELGVFAPCTEAGEGGALEIVAALEALGAAGCPGPFAATYFATQALSGDEVERVADGQALVAMGTRGLFPFGGDAQIYIELDDDHADAHAHAHAHAHDDARVGTSLVEMATVASLGGEPAVRGKLADARVIEGLDRAHALTDVARAAQITGCGRALVDLAAEHARTRTQFKRPIGDFQAVAHPLANMHMALSAATGLTRAAAYGFDHPGQQDAAALMRSAAKARLSASSAALETIHIVHQVFGAVGITLEGPIYHLTRRLRQWVADAPSLDRARECVLAELGWSRDGLRSSTASTHEQAELRRKGPA